MPKFSSILKAQLDACTDKLQYSNTIKTALGNSRRVRCFRDANAAATDPASTGTEFLNMALTGDISIVSGNIVGWGNTGATTVRAAADLSTGASVMVIEGGGHSATYTLGLPGAGTEYALPVSPNGSANIGYAFGPGSGMKAPHLLPSGTGPAAPSIASTTPTILELVDWTDPANPAVVGTISASSLTRQDDWVFQHPELAAEIGDIGVYQFNDTIKWTTPAATRRFEMGGLLLLSAANNSIDGTTQVEQILISFKPYGRWSSYPAMDTFVRAHYPVTDASTWPYTFGPCDNADTADRTILPPFKVNLYTVAGYNGGASDRTPVYTHEWKAFNDKAAGPINSPLLSENQTVNEPSIPRFNCAMMLPWQNVQTRTSSKIGKYYPGVEAVAYQADGGAKGGTSSNAYDPLAVYESDLGTSGTQINSMAHWFALPPYPLKADGALDDAYLTAYESRPKDPNLFSNRDHYPGYRSMGYKYQPGSISGHDWITGKGGQRFDRSPTPSVHAIYTSTQTWLRPEGNVPIRELADNWGLAYFNHSCRWLTNVQTFQSIPKADILAGNWVFANAYYGGGPYAAIGQPLGPQNTVDICGIPNGKGRWPDNSDPEGYMYYAGWQRDSLHSYCNSGLWAVTFNSAMHAVAQTHDFNTQWMCSLGDARPTVDPSAGGNATAGSIYGLRVQAWRWLSYTIQWMVATEHPLGYSRTEIENRFQIELDMMYDKVYKPAFIDNDQRIYYTSIRNLGMPCVASSNNITSNGGSLALYMVHVLVMMRQFGLWSTMRARSDKGKKVLDMMITNLDKYVVDYIMDTDMRDSYYQLVATGKTAGAYTAADIPASWAAQKAMIDSAFPVMPADGNTANYNGYQQWVNFTLMYNGRCDEQTGCPHMYMQYLKARKYYFPENQPARLDAAITKLQGYYDQHAQARINGTAYNWAYYFPSHTALNAPTSVGPN